MAASKPEHPQADIRGTRRPLVAFMKREVDNICSWHWPAARSLIYTESDLIWGNLIFAVSHLCLAWLACWHVLLETWCCSSFRGLLHVKWRYLYKWASQKLSHQGVMAVIEPQHLWRLCEPADSVHPEMMVQADIPLAGKHLGKISLLPIKNRVG